MLSNSHRQTPHVDQLYIAEVTQSIRFPSEHVGIIADPDTVLSTFKSSRLKALKWVLHKVVQKKNADDARLFVCGLSI